MQTKVFKLVKPFQVSDDQFSRQWARYAVPILEAFAIEYAELRVYQNLDGTGRTELLQGDGFDIVEDRYVHWDNYVQKLPGFHTPIYLILHYHGVGDYAKLFPSVRGSAQQIRLGKFYEEAEKNFESGAWLSFVLMCGAIFEGMLYDVLNEELNDDNYKKKRGFSNYLKNTHETNFITDEEKEVMHLIRSQRNLVHLGKYQETYISREQVLNTRKVLDDMIIRFSSILNNSD